VIQAEGRGRACVVRLCRSDGISSMATFVIRLRGGPPEGPLGDKWGLSYLCGVFLTRPRGPAFAWARSNLHTIGGSGERMFPGLWKYAFQR
jgi:hypothetical protein